ncbi:MAG: sulfatase [Bacteroidota bacterium]
MRRQLTIIPIISLLACLLWSCNERPKSEQVKRPNVLFLLADQWRAQSTGYNGDPNLVGKLPNLDRLASQSVDFKNAFSITPVCTPYRAALLTGRYPTSTGMIFNDLHLPEEEVTMGELFKEAGYKTGYIGKWHLDGMGRSNYTPPERRQGFDYWKALECSHDYHNMRYYEGNDPEPKTWEGYSPYATTADAISYMKANANGEDPFLMVLAWATPHFPHQTAPEELQKEFDVDKIILRDNVPEDMRELARKEAVGYYAHMLALDKCFGYIQKALDDLGIADNTIVVFSADHGEMMGSQGVRPRQKQVPWIESVSIPFLIRYPDKYGKDGIEIKEPMNVPDVLPTLLSIAGLEIPDFIEGDDLSGVITGDYSNADDAALVMNVSPFALPNPEYRGVYTSRYAYIKNLDQPPLLFDLKMDSLQMNNLAGQPGNEELLNEMESILQRELSDAGDEFRPRQYYIDKWNYRLNKGGHIDYSEGAPPQGPALNAKQ